jgi:6-pyruvoyltetrahydropterin/6-carboxytetrahydropterin synthase
MMRVSVKMSFSSAHSLRGYMGKCEALHGHNWDVEAVAEAETLDHLGMVIDFKILKKHLDDLLERYDHKHLNEIPPFDEINPSSENIAKFFFDELAKKIDDDRVKIAEMSVWESKGSRATYTPSPK